MSLKKNHELMANYNQWMNENLYKVSSRLEPSELLADRGAFFGSILGTLSHILVGDTIWLKRFSSHPANFTSLDNLRTIQPPASLDEITHTEFSALRQARREMDATIVKFAYEVSDEEYAFNLRYQNTKGLPYCKNFGFLVQHFFNHQTHHRGQLTTLLSQAGIDSGVTDLLMKIPDVDT
ncbi:MAG: DinB family protein [Granulosicoccus sp.]